MPMHTTIREHVPRDLRVPMPWHMKPRKPFLRRHPVGTAAVGALTVGAAARFVRAKGRLDGDAAEEPKAEA